MGSILMLLTMPAFSQQKDQSVPDWVSDKGYWVVEGNIHQPQRNTVRFYNNQHVLTGSQEISKRLNVKRKKVKMQLKTMLESSVKEWAARHSGSNDTDVAGKP